MARVTLDNAALQVLLRDPNGKAGRDLYRRALRVESRAKQLCSGSMVKVRTGVLRSSIKAGQVQVDSRGMYVRIGTNVRYAFLVHEGRGPVFPRNAKVLRWVDFNTRKPVFRMRAGPARPRPFLKTALAAAAG